MGTKALRENLTTVAKLYYVGGLSQDQIAETLGVSRPSISRMLKVCRETKIVRISISALPSYYTSLSQKIKKHFGLKEVVIVPTDSYDEEPKVKVGKAAAQYLNEKIESNMLIGMAWGSTLHYMVNEFKSTKTLTGCQVIQLTGGLHSQSINMDGREMVKSLANKLDANWMFLQMPLVLQNKQLKEQLMHEPEITRHFQLFEQMQIAFVGLGSCVPEQSASYASGYISLEESRNLIVSGAVGDICGHRIMLDGTPADTFLSGRIISVELECLKKIPLVVGIGAGESKAFSIIAAARGKYLNALVIDEVAAMSVIGIAKIQ